MTKIWKRIYVITFTVIFLIRIVQLTSRQKEILYFYFDAGINMLSLSLFVFFDILPFIIMAAIVLIAINGKKTILFWSNIIALIYFIFLGLLQVFFALGDIVAANDIHADFVVWYTAVACVLCIAAITDISGSKNVKNKKKDNKELHG